MTPPASSSSSEALRIDARTQVAYVQALVRTLAVGIGFSTRDEWAIATAVSEAVTNIVKFAGTGTLTVRILAGDPPGLEFVAADQGPGMADVASALRDGVSEGVDLDANPAPGPRRGRGSGCGAMRRLMDELEVRAAPGVGTVVTGRKWLRTR